MSGSLLVQDAPVQLAQGRWRDLFLETRYQTRDDLRFSTTGSRRTPLVAMCLDTRAMI